jgi:uncharacterized repeat protein (TIGR03803 family)
VLFGTTFYGGAHDWGTAFSIPIAGGTPTVLYDFDGLAHGLEPSGKLARCGSNLYGTTYGGGAYGLGEVFGIPVTGGTPTILFSFDIVHGRHASGSVSLAGDTLYGVTGEGGGAHDSGTIYALTLPDFAKAGFDHDHDVDPDDLAVLVECMSGPAVQFSIGCDASDLDSDGDVDLSDFGIFQRCYSGANKPVDPNCAN